MNDVSCFYSVATSAVCIVGPLGWMDGTETGRAAYAMNLRICNHVHARHVKIDAIEDLHNVADPADPLLVWSNMRTLMYSFTKCHVPSLASPAFEISYVQNRQKKFLLV